MKLPSAYEMRLKLSMTDELDYALSDIKEKLFNGDEHFEVDVVALDNLSKVSLMEYLEFLGYNVDQSYGEDFINVSFK